MVVVLPRFHKLLDVKSVPLTRFRGVTFIEGGTLGDSMKKAMIAMVAVLAVTMVAHFSIAKEDTQKINGVLIDAKCGKGKKEEKASGHPAAWVAKGCGGGQALALGSGDKTYKIEDDSKEKALAYLGSENGE